MTSFILKSFLNDCHKLWTIFIQNIPATGQDKAEIGEKKNLDKILHNFNTRQKVNTY